MRRAARVAVGALVTAALAPASADAFPTTGEQRLLVVAIEHAHPNPPGCTVDARTMPTCPRRSAAEWEQVLQRELNAWFGVESYERVSWTVRVVANPAQADGWWPAPHTREQYAAPGNNNFTSGAAIVRDAAELILPRAIAAGVISRAEVLAHHRLLVVDNFARSGGQANGENIAVNYLLGQVRGRPVWMQTTAAVVAESATDATALSTIEHELGHQLGEPDLYSQAPCPLMEPGGVTTMLSGDDADCVGPWDHMALDYLTQSGLGAFTRTLPGWLDDEQIRYEARSFSDTLTLSPVAQPTGDPLALRLPDDPFLQEITRLFGNRGYFKGLQAECRPRIRNDAGQATGGLLVSYIDSSRGRAWPQVVVRSSATETVGAAILTPGEEYANATLGVRIRYVGATANGGCRLAVNREEIDRPALMAALPAFSGVATDARTLDASASASVFGAAGLQINPVKLGAAASRRQPLRVRPVRRGRRVRVRFAFANAGSLPTAGGVATIRVTQPYTVAARCGSQAPPLGRVVERVALAALAPGERGEATARFRARRRGPIGVSVALTAGAQDAPATDQVEQSVLGFQTHRVRRGGNSRARTLRVRVTTPTACTAPATFSASALTLPRGWSVRGNVASVRPGATRTLRLRVRPPRGARRRLVSIPIAIAGAVGHPALPGSGPSRPFGHGEPQVVGGLDLLARATPRGARPPAFALGPEPTAPPVLAYPSLPPLPRAAASLTLTCPETASVGKEAPVTGTLAPEHPGTTVLLVYHHETGTVTERSVTTDASSAFHDAFAPKLAGKWALEARWAGDFDHVAAVSPSCSFAVL